MPIRTRLIFDKQDFAGVDEATVEAESVLFGQLAEKEFTKTRRNMLKALRKYPRPSVHPFVWSFDPAANERARKWWFANINNGNIKTDGSRYIRTGALGRSWEIDFIEPGVKRGQKDTYQIRVMNNAKDSKGRARFRWVVGTFDQRTGKKWQIPGHRRTGWYLVQDVTKRYFEVYEETLTKQYKSTVARVQNR